MSPTVRILFVDDSDVDVEIACWHLQKARFVISSQVVTSEDSLRSALTARVHDIIVSDVIIAAFDGWAALRIAQALVPDLPFIFHCGSPDDETRRRASLRGAYGTVNKDHPKELVELVHQVTPYSSQ